MERVYLEYCTTDGTTIKCPIQTNIVVFVLNYCQAQSVQVVLVKTLNSDCNNKIKAGSLDGLAHEFIDVASTPEGVSDCILPVMVKPADCMIWTGLGGVLRHIIKVEDHAKPQHHLQHLLV